jgi:cell division protein FtsB
MKLLVVVLIILLGIFQYNLWFGQSGVIDSLKFKKEIAEQAEENESLAARNQKLLNEIHSLKEGRETIETLAREQMDMIKQDETYYRFVR